MRHRTKTLQATRLFTLTSSVNQKTGKKHYVIAMDPWSQMALDPWAVAALFDPFGNRGVRGGRKWKFKSQVEAEKLLTIALIKWSGAE